MSEEEMLKSDLHTIYRLIEIHSEFNSPDKNKNNNKNQKVDEGETFIDNIIF